MKQFFHHLYLGVLVCFSFVLSAFGAAWPDGQVIGMPMKLTNSSNVYYSNNVKTFDQFSVTRYMLNSRSYQNGTNDYPENYAYYMTIKKGGTYTFTGSMQGSIIVDTTEPVTLILDNVNIQAYNTKFSSVFKPNDSAYYQLRAAISIENNSQVTILLKGSNSLKGYDDGSSGFANTMMSSAGIYVENTYSNYTQWNRKQRLASVTIEDYPDDNAVGSLYAKGGFQSAGIGGQANRLAGNITINSGDIHAVGGDWGCGIGDGDVFRTKGANTADNDYVCDVEQREYSREGLVKGTNDKNTYQSYYEVGYNTSYAEIVINGGTIFGEATTDTPGIGTADELPSRWRAINYGKSNGYGALWGGKKIILNAGVVVALSGETAQTHSTAFGPGASTVLPAVNLIINQCSYTENTDGSVTTNWTYMVACTRTSSMSYAASNQGGFVVPAISDLSTATVWNMALNPETHVGKNLDFFALSGASLDNLIWPEFPNNYLHDRTVFGDKMIAGISVVMPYLYGYVITDGSNTVITGYAGGPGANNQWEGGDLHRPPVVTPPSDEYVFTGGAATFTVTGVAREGGNKLTFTWYRTNDGGKTWESVQTETRSVSKGTASSTYTQTGVTEAMEGTSRYFCVAVEKGTDGVSRTGVSGTATIYVPEMVVKTNIEMDPEAILLNQEPTAAQVTLKVASVGAKGQVGAYQSLTKMFDNGIQDTQLIKVNTADDSLLTGALSVPSFTVDKVVVGEGKIYDIKISKLTLTSTEDRWYWIAKSVDADTWYYPSYWGKEEKSLSRAQAAGEAYKSYHPDVDVPVETNYTHSVLTYTTNLNNTVTYPIYGFVTNYYNYTMSVDSLTYGSTTVPTPTDGSNVYTVPDNRGQVKASDVTDTAWDDAHMPGNNDAAVAYDFANDRADGQLKVVLTSNNLPPEITDPADLLLPMNSTTPATFTVTGTANEHAETLTFKWYESYDDGKTWTLVETQTDVKVGADDTATVSHDIAPGTSAFKSGTLVRAEVYETSPADYVTRSDASEPARLTLYDSTLPPPEITDPQNVTRYANDTQYPAVFTAIGTAKAGADKLTLEWSVSTDGGKTWKVVKTDTDVPVDANDQAATSFTIANGDDLWATGTQVKCKVYETSPVDSQTRTDVSEKATLTLIAEGTPNPPEITDPQDVALPKDSTEPAVFTATGTAHEGAEALTFDWYESYDDGATWVKVVTETLATTNGQTTTTHTIAPGTDAFTSGTRVRAEVFETSPNDGVTRTDASEEAELLLYDKSLLPPEITDPTDVTRYKSDTQHPAVFEAVGTAKAGATELTFTWYVLNANGDWGLVKTEANVPVDPATHAAPTSFEIANKNSNPLWKDGTTVKCEVAETSPLDGFTRTDASETAQLHLLPGTPQPPVITDPQNVTLPANSLVPADFSAVGTAKEGAAELAFDWYMTVPGGQEVKVKTEVVKVDEDGNATTAYSIWPETAGWKTGTTMRAVVTETSPKDSIDRTDASETAKLTLTSASSGEPPQISDPSDVYAIEGETATFAVIGVPGGKATSLDFVWYQSTDGGTTWEEAARTTGTVDSTTGAARSTLTVTGVTDRNDETLYRAIVIEGSGSDAKMAGSKNAELFVPEIEVIPNVVLDSSLPVELRPTGARVAISVVTTNAAGEVVHASQDIAAAFGTAFIAAGASAYTYDETTETYYLDLAFDESGTVLTGSLDLPAYTVTRTQSGTGSISEHIYGTSNIVDVVYFRTTYGDGTINQYTAPNQWGEWITYFFPACFGSDEEGYLKARAAGWAKTSYGDVMQKDVYMTNGVKQVEYVIRDVEVSYPKYAYTTNYLAYAFETVALNYGDVGGTANWVALDDGRVFQPYDNPTGASLTESEAVSLTSLNVSLGEGDQDVAWDPATDRADGQLKEVLTGYVNPNIPPIVPGDPTKQPPTGPAYGKDPTSGDNINDPEDPYHPGYVIMNDPEDPWLVVPDPLNPTTTDEHGNVTTNWVAGTPGVEQPFVETDGEKVFNEMRVVIDVVGPGTLTWRDLVRDPSTQQDATLVVTVDGGEPVTIYTGNLNAWDDQSLVFGGDMDTAHQVVITFQGNSSGSVVRQAHGYVDDIIWKPYVDAKYEDVKAPDTEPFTFANLGTDPTAATHHVGVTIHEGTNVVTTSTVNGDGKQLTSTVAGEGVTWESTTTTGTEDLWYAIQDPGPSNYVNNTIAQTAPTLSAKEVAEMTVTGLEGPCKFSWDMKIADDATSDASTLEVIVTRHVTDANGDEIGEPVVTTYTYTAAEIADWTHGYLPLSGPWSSGDTTYEVTFRYTNNGDGDGVCSIDNIKWVRPDINIGPELHDDGVQPANGSEYGADDKKRPDPTSEQNVNDPNDPYYPQYTVTNDDTHPWEVVPDPKAGTTGASDPGKSNDDVAQTPDSLQPGDESKVVVTVTGDGEFSWKSLIDADPTIDPTNEKEYLPQVVVLVDGKTNTVYTTEEDWTKHTVHVVDETDHDNATHTIEIIYVQGGAEDGAKAASTGFFDNFNWQRSAIQSEMEQLVVTEPPSSSEEEERSKVCITNEYQSGWMPVYETKTNVDGSTTTTTIGVRSADGSEGVPGDKTEDKLHSEFDVYVKGTGELMVERITFPAYDPANGIKTDDNGHFTITITDSWDDDNDPTTPDKTETKEFVLPEPGDPKCPANYSVTTNENGIVTVENLVIWVYGEPNVKHDVKFVDERTAESSTDNSATVVEHITWCTLLQAKALWIIDHEDPGQGEVFLAFEPELKVVEEIAEWARRCAQAQMIRVKCGRSRAEAEASDPLVATFCNDAIHPVRSHKVWIKVALKNAEQQDLSQNSYWRIYINGPAIQLSGMNRNAPTMQTTPPDGTADEKPIISMDGALSPNTFGILQVESKTANTLIAVPWTWYSKFEDEAADIPVCKLVKTTNLTEGDQLLYYDKKSGKYYVWTVEEDEEKDELVWRADVNVVVKGIADPKQDDGKIEMLADDGTKSIKQQMSVARGLGMWLVRQHPVDDKGNAIPFWVYGQSVATKVVTPIETPSASLVSSNADISKKVVCNILGNPYATEVEINKLQFVDADGNPVVPDENDRIWVPNGTAAGTYVIYRDHDGNPETPMCWYYTKSTVQGRKRVTEYVTDIRVPAGLGFWYDRRGTGAMKIVWPVPTEGQSGAVDVTDGAK